MFANDRFFLENKYHKIDEPFNPFDRMAYHGYAFDPTTGDTDEEILVGLQNMRSSLEALPHPVAKAKAFAYVLEHTRIDVNEHDFFVGLYSLNRLPGQISSEAWNQKLFTEKLPEVRQTMDDLCRSGAATIWPDFDHVVPDWNAILTLGFPGLLTRAIEHKKKHEAAGTLTDEVRAFFEGIEITYTAILALIDRLYRYAATQTHEKAKTCAECLKHLHDGAAQSFYEALQCIYLYFMLSECFDGYQVRSLGNGLDASLTPFYQNDLARGVSEEQIREYLRYFLIQWSAIGNYWGQPFYLGGTNKEGGTRYNDLSYAILEVYDELGIYNPKIQLKINHNTPDRLLFKAFDMIRRGHSSLVFCCEPGMIRAVMSYGATYDEARDMDIRGCYETGVRANEVSTGTAYVNALKPVEYVFSNGFDKNLGKVLGLQTGALSELRTFEDFYAAVLRQWAQLIEGAIDCANRYEPYLGYINPSNMYSACMEGALEKGVDAYQGGVKFNNSALLNCGLASLVDAVMAVKSFVYDRKEISLEELGKALEANWNGYEVLHSKILNSPHKYGCGDAETDRYATALARFFAFKVNNRPNARGGVFKAILHSARMFIEQRHTTGATPDGRHAGAEISKNASPSVGMDKNGVTALIGSVLKLEPYLYPESFCLDTMLHPSAVSGEEGLQVMKALLFTYMQGGGMSIQFNVFDLDTLKEAQKHPDKYRNLQVRVCGWNVLWNNLSATEQEAYMERAAHTAL